MSSITQTSSGDGTRGFYYLAQSGSRGGGCRDDGGAFTNTLILGWPTRLRSPNGVEDKARVEGDAGVLDLEDPEATTEEAPVRITTAE